MQTPAKYFSWGLHNEEQIVLHTSGEGEKSGDFISPSLHSVLERLLWRAAYLKLMLPNKEGI